VDDGRQTLMRVAEIGQQPVHPAEGEVDELGIKAREPYERGIDGSFR